MRGGGSLNRVSEYIRVDTMLGALFTDVLLEGERLCKVCDEHQDQADKQLEDGVAFHGIPF